MPQMRKRLSFLAWPLLAGGGVLLSVGLIGMWLPNAVWAAVLALAGLMIFCLGAALSERRPERESERGEGLGDLSHEEFERLEDEVERLAAQPPAGAEDDAFVELVRDALDELPEFVQEDLRNGNLPVVVSDRGREHRWLGIFEGSTVASELWDRRIVIFRDTLTAAYGADPEELRRQVAITVRHEVAHFYGADERRVRELGL